jgi:hypothetical protein
MTCLSRRPFASVRLFVVAAVSGVLGLLFAAHPATANGRMPAANRIVFSPTNPKLVIVRATYGLLVSSDGGTTWTFLCEDALGMPKMATEDPAIGLTATNALVVGLQLPAGLEVSHDNGCNFSCIVGPPANETIVDLAVRQDLPDTLVALTNTALSPDAGGGAHSQVFQSTNDGATWAPLGVALDPHILVTTLDVARGSPHRLYVSATTGFGPARKALLLTSIEDGATWTEWPAPLDTRVETAIYIGAVDPFDADRVYLRTNGPSRLLITVPSDAGLSFRTVLTLTSEMLGFALSPDGSTIYAGSEMDGLFVGDRSSMAFVHRPSVVLGSDAGPHAIHVRCLAARAGELWACADEPGGFVVGLSTDNGATFSPKLHLGGVAAPIDCSARLPASLACGADANGSLCSGAPFANLCATVGCTPSRVPTAQPPRRSCACSLVGARENPSGLGLLGALITVAGRRETRRACSRRRCPRDHLR